MKNPSATVNTIKGANESVVAVSWVLLWDKRSGCMRDNPIASKSHTTDLWDPRIMKLDTLIQLLMIYQMTNKGGVINKMGVFQNERSNCTP